MIRKVLLVDDDPDIRAVADLSLSAVGGMEVVTAESGQQALELAGAAQPDLILLDVMMPGMDGPTALMHLRAMPAVAAIPVVFLTAKVQKHEITGYLALGALGVIEKPFDPMTLAEEIRRLAAAAPRAR